MKKPDMVFFDYGQTLVGESPYNHKKGFEAVMKYVKSDNADADKLTDLYLSLRKRIWSENKSNLEAHHNFLLRYIMEYYNIESEYDYDTLELIFWENAVEFERMEGICETLELIYEKNIRTAVISNIDYSERTLEKVINRFIPNHHFEFIIASSEYIFRKPDKEIFDLAMHKAGVSTENVWYIGNDEYYDAEGAAKNGIQSFWYTGSRFYKPKREPICEYTRIEHWNEFMDIIRKF